MADSIVPSGHLEIDLGFSEECEAWEVKSWRFPSKIGGKPAWLAYESLPSTNDLECSSCNNPLTFLCQIYAPFEDCDKNFHRALYVFICKTASCLKKNSESIKVFRSNIPRRNKFYSYDAPGDKEIAFDETKWVQLCNLCGCLGSKNCSKCKKTVYCCRQHQVIDWKQHKTFCGQNVSCELNPYLFAESEIVTEKEDYKKTDVDEAKELENFEELRLSGKAGSLVDVEDDELDKHAFAEDDKTFSQFKKRIADNSDQVLRYQLGGAPLWIAEAPIPTDIPKCEYCAGPRQFEFQVMPQMLAVLNETTIDFGVLVVYTCVKSCFAVQGYKKEFVFKQDVSE